MKVTEALSQAAILEQLAEECAELGQAALKWARVLRGENPARVTLAQAGDHFIEEVADVMMCIDLTTSVYDWNEINRIRERKMERWEKSLDEARSK